MAWAESDPEAQPRLAALMTTLRELGWIDGQNLRIELRWSAGDLERAGRDFFEQFDPFADGSKLTNPVMLPPGRAILTIRHPEGLRPRWRADVIRRRFRVNSLHHLIGHSDDHVSRCQQRCSPAPTR